MNRISGYVRSLGGQVFAERMETLGLDINDMDDLMALTYAIETKAGTIPPLSPTGAAGAMQIVSRTAKSLIKNERALPDEAWDLVGLDKDAFMKLSRAQMQGVLIGNEPLNVLLAMAKYFSTGLNEWKNSRNKIKTMDVLGEDTPTFDPATGTLK